MRELGRAAEAQHLSVERFLSVPHVLHSIQLRDIDVLDLTVPATQELLGLEPDDLAGDHGPCQEVGHAAWFLEFHGVLAPSAVGEGVTVALFDHNTPPDQIVVQSTRPLGLPTYRSLAAAD